MEPEGRLGGSAGAPLTCTPLLLQDFPELEWGGLPSSSEGLEVWVGYVGRLMPSVLLIDTGENCLRSRNFQTIGKMALLSPFQMQP